MSKSVTAAAKEEDNEDSLATGKGIDDNKLMTSEKMPMDTGGSKEEAEQTAKEKAAKLFGRKKGNMEKGGFQSLDTLVKKVD